MLSCNRIPREVEKALNVAGKNKVELYKVIEHYRKIGEKEKLKAVYFLIANMSNKYYLWSNAFSQFQNLLIDSLTNFDSKKIQFKNKKLNRFIWIAMWTNCLILLLN